MTFNGLREALALPAPERGQPFIEYSHQSVPRFKVRVHPPDSNQRVMRQWAIRAKYTLAGQQKEDRSTLGQLEALDKTQTTVDYKTALERALARLREIEEMKAAPPGSLDDVKRLTVAEVWARHEVATRTQREATTQKERAQYKRYFEHLSERFLDELDYDFWARFVAGLGNGRLLNADGLTSRALPTPRAEATVKGVMSLAAKLFSIAHRFKGLKGLGANENPAGKAKTDLVGAPNVRTGYVKLHRLADTWRAADALCAPWARDQLRLYVLTGLRHSLMSELKFSQVDARARLLSISPHSPGTKRRGARTPANAPDIRLPLCATALAIIEARRPWAPDPEGYVWYAVTQPGGKAAKVPKEGQKHSDPRSNWVQVAARALDGTTFMRHDLRRTFANLAVAAGAELMGTSLLMLHSPRTVARVLNLPDVTLEYINTAEARGRMRAASDAIERYVLGLLDGSIKPPQDEVELPPELKAAVGNDKDD